MLQVVRKKGLLQRGWPHALADKEECITYRSSDVLSAIILQA